MNMKMILLVIVAGFLASACSTPAVPSQTQEQASNTAASSYENCSQSLHPYGYGDQCNYVYPSSGGTSSYYGYVYGNKTGYSQVRFSGADAEAGSGENAESEAILHRAYLGYLKTASVEDLQEMTAQWNRLAASVKPE